MPVVSHRERRRRKMPEFIASDSAGPPIPGFDPPPDNATRRDTEAGNPAKRRSRREVHGKIIAKTRTGIPWAEAEAQVVRETLAEAQALPPENGRTITTESWTYLVHAWWEKPSVLYLAQATGLPRGTCLRAMHYGWPQFNLPPLYKVSPPAVDVHRELAKLDGDEGVHAAERAATERAAREARGAQVALDSAVTVGEVALSVAQKLAEKVAAGEFHFNNKVTMHDLNVLAKAINTINTAVERGLRIARLHAGEPEAVLGIQIGSLLTPCTPEELREIQLTGQLPARILGLQDARAAMRAEAIDVQATPRDEAPRIPIALARPHAGPIPLAELLAKEDPVFTDSEDDDDVSDSDSDSAAE